MTAEEKIKHLQQELAYQIAWYKDVVSEHGDDDYAYDEAHNEFGRGECYEILRILSQD